MLNHEDSFRRQTRWRARTKRDTYAPEHEAYYLQFRCSPTRVLWFGEILAAGLLRNLDGKTREKAPVLAAHAATLGFVIGVGTGNGELLNANKADAKFLQAVSTASDLLVHWESLYRGILYGATLAVVSLTSAARTSEITQISMDRWHIRDVPEIRDGVNTGRTVRIYLQRLLPKGGAAEEERQLFLISPDAMRLLMEIGKGLAANPARRIPLARATSNEKAESLGDERYLFQWPGATTLSSGTPHRALVLANTDINRLIRFMFIGLELTVPHSGTTIRITVHLLRHVLATYARHRANIPPEVIAFLLHHRHRSASTRDASPEVSEATDYYSQEPESETLARLVQLQQDSFLKEDTIVIAPISDEELDELDEDLRETLEHYGTIGTTAFGFCKAGVCMRREDRALCIGCPYLVIYYRMLANAQSWHSILLQEIERLEQQGNGVEARQRRVKVKHLDNYIAGMQMQIQVLADGGQLPPHFAIAAQHSQSVEVFDHAL